jgi:hypothetical protein
MMEVFKRGTGILPVKNVRFPMKCRKESRARCPCHDISQVSHNKDWTIKKLNSWNGLTRWDERTKHFLSNLP